LAAAFGFNLPLHAELVDAIKAVVNNGVVTYAEVEEFAAPAARRCSGNMPASWTCPAKNLATRSAMVRSSCRAAVDSA